MNLDPSITALFWSFYFSFDILDILDQITCLKWIVEVGAGLGLHGFSLLEATVGAGSVG